MTAVYFPRVYILLELLSPSAIVTNPRFQPKTCARASCKQNSRQNSLCLLIIFETYTISLKEIFVKPRADFGTRKLHCWRKSFSGSSLEGCGTRKLLRVYRVSYEHVNDLKCCEKSFPAGNGILCTVDSLKLKILAVCDRGRIPTV